MKTTLKTDNILLDTTILLAVLCLTIIIYRLTLFTSTYVLLLVYLALLLNKRFYTNKKTSQKNEVLCVGFLSINLVIKYILVALLILLIQLVLLKMIIAHFHSDNYFIAFYLFCFFFLLLVVYSDYKKLQVEFTEGSILFSNALFLFELDNNEIECFSKRNEYSFILHTKNGKKYIITIPRLNMPDSHNQRTELLTELMGKFELYVD